METGHLPATCLPALYTTTFSLHLAFYIWDDTCAIHFLCISCMYLIALPCPVLPHCLLFTFLLYLLPCHFTYYFLLFDLCALMIGRQFGWGQTGGWVVVVVDSWAGGGGRQTNGLLNPLSLILWRWGRQGGRGVTLHPSLPA